MRNVGARFVIEQFAVPVVAVHRDQDMAAGVGNARAASLAAEAAKHHRVNHCPGARTPAW